MFNDELKKLMAKRGLTARGLHGALNDRGVTVTLRTVRAWMQGTRRPKKYVSDAILLMLTS